jgi:hypothetical protein
MTVKVKEKLWAIGFAYLRMKGYSEEPRLFKPSVDLYHVR